MFPARIMIEIHDWIHDWNRATQEIHDWYFLQCPRATEKTEARSGKLFLSRPRWRSVIGLVIGIAPLKKFVMHPFEI